MQSVDLGGLTGRVAAQPRSKSSPTAVGHALAGLAVPESARIVGGEAGFVDGECLALKMVAVPE